MPILAQQFIRWRFEDSIHILMMLQALAIERAAATRTAERVLHYHIARYHVAARLSATGWHQRRCIQLSHRRALATFGHVVRASDMMKIGYLHI
jgi:hypothetical protein